MIPKVLAVVGDTDGCSLWRIFQPFSALKRLGFVAEWGFRTDKKLADIVHKFDAVIVPRLHWPVEEQDQADRWFAALHNAGKAVIFEVDDDMFSDDFYRRLVNLHSKDPNAAEDVRRSILYTLQNSDGATVSSQRLATIVRRYTDKPVKVVPNFMDLKWFRAVQAKSERKVKGLCIGWAGGLRPDSDVEQMAFAWGRIAQRYPHVTFFVQGHHADVITRNVPKDRLKSSDWLPIEAYPLPLVNVDIGCCPLSDTGFNRAKCVAGNTLVYTRQGLINIAELVQTSIIDTLKPLNILVWTTKGWAMSQGAIYNGEQDTIRIRTKMGFQIEGTPNHPIRRCDDSWARLDELNVGDSVRIEPVQFAKDYPWVPFNLWAVRQRDAANHNAPSLPQIKIDENWGKFMGYVMGDGHIGVNHIRVTCDLQDQDVIEDFSSVCENLGFESRLRDHTTQRVKKNYQGQDVVVSSARLNDFMEYVGMTQEKRKFLCVPWVILRSPKPVIRAFLQGLFEADGTVSAKDSRLSMTTVSERLAHEIQLLLTGFGVVARIYAKYNKVYDKTYYNVALTRDAANKFAEEVGFVGQRKRQETDELVAKPHSNRFEPQAWCDEIVEISRGRSDVYDITVPGPHEFGAGGFMAHNTYIKAMEYAVSSAAVVASPTVYGQIIEDGYDGYIVQTVDEWEDRLSRLIESANLRNRLQQRLLSKVETHHSLEQNAWKWVEAWSDIIEAHRRRIVLPTAEQVRVYA